MKMMRIKSEKGQGLTEYVLILAFIAGLAFMMFGGNGSFKDTLVNTFTKTASILAGLFGEDDGYVTASQNYPGRFTDWNDKNSNYLKDIPQKERLKADQEGLALIASLFLGKTKDDVEGLMKGFTNTHSDLQWVFDNLDSSRMGPVTNGWSEIMVPLSYWDTDFDANNYSWLECGNNGKLIRTMAGEDNKNIVKEGKESGISVTHNRIFYSDEMLSSDTAVAMKVHYDGDTVDQVWIAAQTGTMQLTDRKGQNVTKTNNKNGQVYAESPGNSALNGNSTSIQGLDLTVTGSSSDYKYKVNN